MHLKKALVFVISFLAGLGFIQLTDSVLLKRSPAAIRQYYDFTNLRGSALEIALKERVVSNLEIIRENKNLGLKLGHFAFMNNADEKKFGCEEYPKVILQFESDDMAVSGEKSRMEVESDCQASADTTMIETVWIPLDKVYTEKALDGDFQFSENKPVSIRFSNISDEWPKKWHLIGINLNGQNSNLRIDRNEMQKILGHPLVLSF